MSCVIVYSSVVLRILHVHPNSYCHSKKTIMYFYLYCGADDTGTAMSTAVAGDTASAAADDTDTSAADDDAGTATATATAAVDVTADADNTAVATAAADDTLLPPMIRYCRR